MMKKFTAVTLFFFAALFISTGTAFGLAVTPTDDGTVLVNTILGTGITSSNVFYSGGPGASGTFTDGLSSGIGMDEGILLTSGWASDAVGPNSSDATTRNTGTGGDADLNALTSSTTYNATVLEFDFVTDSGDLFFNFVFASEEYNEYTNSSFNDVFAFFLNGENIALIPGTDTPVAINNVNGGNPLGTNATNPEYFNNNDPSDGTPSFNLEYDGFTDVFTATKLGLDTSATHHIKLAIADTSDTALDSGVFIEAGTFSGEPPEPPGPAPVPEPGTFVLLGSGLVGLVLYRRKFKK